MRTIIGPSQLTEQMVEAITGAEWFSNLTANREAGMKMMHRKVAISKMNLSEAAKFDAELAGQLSEILTRELDEIEWQYRNVKCNLLILEKHKPRRAPISEFFARSIISEANGLCHYCGKPANSIDHIVPVAKGGTNDRNNLVACCKSCNSAKGTADYCSFIGRIEKWNQ